MEGNSVVRGEWEDGYHAANNGTDPRHLADLGGTVLGHQIYQGVER